MEWEIDYIYWRFSDFMPQPEGGWQPFSVVPREYGCYIFLRKKIHPLDTIKALHEQPKEGSDGTIN